ncbi:sensor histidine kinase [Flexivirga sp. ID2601S]|uniref:histidine kinase n=1 Tax=Flexivirga aerilata TaxID=1656889 RepID=A0A849AHD1_9MICO|nr:sensor histidine kinase [Flexivirga aerilata]NNG40254.1 sensor histidine kinase [Flexivirga aerilata]
MSVTTARRPRSPARWSLAAQTFALQAAIALLVVGLGTGAAYLQARSASNRQATAQVLSVAESVAATPQVAQALSTTDPSATLQPLAEAVRRSTHTDFVVVMSPTGRRYTHPDPAQIGKQFVGHIADAGRGGQVVEDYTGTLGPSRRAVVPVTSGGRVVGLVAVGVAKSAVAARVRDQLPALLLAGLLAAALTGLGTVLVAARVRRRTRGLGARQLQEATDYHDAVLHAVREGLLLTDPHGRLRVVNDEAARLLGLPADAVQLPTEQLGLPASIEQVLTDGLPREDELHVAGGAVLVVNKAAATWRGDVLGYVVTLRDRTELEGLTGELDSARSLATALRAQAHESNNRLHTIVSLIELGQPEEAVEFATGQLQHAQRLTDTVVESVTGEPAVAALLVGKTAEAHERGIDLAIDAGEVWPPTDATSHDLVTIVGNLVDNAFDAVADNESERRVSLTGERDGDDLVLTVSDNGPGLTEAERDEVFRPGFSTKATDGRGIGLALVAQTVQRLHGSIEVYTGPGAGRSGALFEVRLPVSRDAR